MASPDSTREGTTDGPGGPRPASAAPLPSHLHLSSRNVIPDGLKTAKGTREHAETHVWWKGDTFVTHQKHTSRRY